MDHLDDEAIVFELEEVVAIGDEVIKLKLDADVLLSRGITAQLLKETQFIPVVDIPVQGIDLIRCLYDCKIRFGKKKVAVIGSLNMIYGVEELSDIVGLPIQSYIMNDNEESEQLVDQAVDDGCEVILSGVKTCGYAHSRGLANLLIRTGKESFCQALSEAKRLALVSRREQEKAKRYQTILDHAYEGVIAIDGKGRVTVFNTAAQQTLSIPEPLLIGRSVYDVLPQGKLRAILLNTEDYHEHIITYQAIQLAIKKVAIFLKGKKVGNMVTFQDVTGIQAMERKIRKKIYLRGHIAKHTFDDILHVSRKIGETIETAKRYGEVDSNILIIGETGTGKEMFAQSIHNHSNRKYGPFVAINCAALPENLLESELFGYVEGAFTGAMKGGKQGFFELAHGGTIFLDEIGEISPTLQSRLLRVLQEREIMRIGDDKVIPVDVRVLSATNKDLFQMVKKGDFREDLYYRLDILRLTLPPLRERREDIPLLVDAFIHEKMAGQAEVTITDAAKRKLTAHNWEGNIRHLKNFCERLVVLSNGRTIDLIDVEKWIGPHIQEGDIPIKSEGALARANYSERERIVHVLRKSHFNKGKAANELGISRTTLWRKIRELNIETI
nr:sigma 54-interacting transcriptional regulator [Ammoniphilus resinae]